jgi:GNAT superfamily N-acetyltransferase
MAELIECREAQEADAADLAALHRAAWSHAYAGILPGVTLAQMIGRRGPAWWRATAGRQQALVLDLGTGPVGYALFGPSRRPMAGTGEVFELYLQPVCHGIGLGRRLFEASRRRLSDAGRPRTIVWALEANTLACRFYRGVGGREVARAADTIGGRRLEKVAFIWT